MLNVAIIGCGKIADEHANKIQSLINANIVAVCDKEELMAIQLSERYKIKRYYDDLVTMINRSKPDVVHITTPPDSHYILGKTCLEHNCHIFIEKPFTVYEHEAREIIEIARLKNLKVTVGHDSSFDHAERKMRNLIKNNYLGGSPIHIESYYGYDLSDEYAIALTKDQKHWVRKLPGKLLHNIISHGIGKIVEHLRCTNPRVIAHGFTSSFLKQLNENEIIDELRVIITDNTQTTAYFTFSSQIRPKIHQICIYGPENGIFVDSDHQTCIKIKGKTYKSYLNRFVPPIGYAFQYFENVLQNTRSFINNDFHMKSGLKYLIDKFYKSIIFNTEVPIRYSDIILTTKIMDEIFNQLEQ